MKSGASEADIWQTIDMFKERYSDYGSDRRSAIEFHTNQLEKLLLPTKLTKLCMWMLLHMDVEGDAPLPATSEAVASTPALKAEEGGSGSSDPMLPPPPSTSTGAPEGAAAGAAAGGGEGGGAAAAGAAAAAAEEGAGGVIAAPPPPRQPPGEGEAGPQPPARAARRLWATVSAELGVTEAQQRALLAQRGTVQGMDEDLQVTSGMLADLRALIDDKNASLDQELLEVQKILTPTQTAKFILWITKNPACMHMLNQLWRFVYEKAPLPANFASAVKAARASASAASASASALASASASAEEPPAAKRAKADDGAGEAPQQAVL